MSTIKHSWTRCSTTAALRICYELASIIQVGEKWRAQVRRRGHKPQTRTCDSKVIANRWARKVETEIEEGAFHDSGKAKHTTLASLITRYRKERIKPIGRSHGYAIDPLSRRLGETLLPTITAELVIEYTRSRTCKPVTWASELSYLGQILRVARAVWKPFDRWRSSRGTRELHWRCWVID